MEKHWVRWALAGILLTGLVGLSGCAPITVEPAPGTVTQTTTAIPTETATPAPTSTWTSVPTATASPSATPPPSPTLTPAPTATPTPVPAPLEMFTTSYLRYGAQAASYIASPCAYLERRWAADASPPGTVVLPVMFHSIAQPGAPEPTDPKDISYEDFQEFMSYARREGWQTITTEELLAFLLTNASIPRYSLLMIIDDRRPGVVEEYFMPLLEKNDWTLTVAYIADPTSMQWAMRKIEELNLSGRLDVQSHGLTGELYILPETSDEAITHEILGSTAVLEEHFGKRPLAFIWPGGNFTENAVRIARSGGYKLGFTAFSRGPLMFNWVPQGELERAVHDPLMLLPRAWSKAMSTNLYEAKKVSQAAQADALDRYPFEADYYRTYCGGELPAPQE